MRHSDGDTARYSIYDLTGKMVYQWDRATETITDYIFLGGEMIVEAQVGMGNGSQNVNNTNVGYTGHQWDNDTGLNYMQARYYDPLLGRFYSNDPVGYTAKNPVMSFNRYLYVNNNPYKYTDPTGMCFWDACIGETMVVGFVASVLTAQVVINNLNEPSIVLNESSPDTTVDDAINDLDDKSTKTKKKVKPRKVKSVILNQAFLLMKSLITFPAIRVRRKTASLKKPLMTAQQQLYIVLILIMVEKHSLSRGRVKKKGNIGKQKAKMNDSQFLYRG